MTVTEAPTDRVRHQFSVEEFYAVCGLDPVRYEHYELINGVMYEPMTESIAHARLAREVFTRLSHEYPARMVWMSGSVELANDGSPLPDVYVTTTEDRQGQFWNGTDLVLAVEVSLSTLTFDTTEKKANYARGQVPTYYVVEANAHPVVVHRFSEPEGDDYGQRLTVPFDEAFPPSS
jgi:Uma2 family endonuclease